MIAGALEARDVTRGTDMEATYDAGRLLDIHRLLLPLSEALGGSPEPRGEPNRAASLLQKARCEASLKLLELEHRDLTEPDETAGRPVAERFAELFALEVERLFSGSGRDPIGGNDNLSFLPTTHRLD